MSYRKDQAAARGLIRKASQSQARENSNVTHKIEKKKRKRRTLVEIREFRKTKLEQKLQQSEKQAKTRSAKKRYAQQQKLFSSLNIDNFFDSLLETDQQTIEEQFVRLKVIYIRLLVNQLLAASKVYSTYLALRLKFRL